MSVDISFSRKSTQGSITGLKKATRVGFVGTSFGKNVVITDYKANLALSDGTSDTLSGLTINSINKVSLNPNDDYNIFEEGKDYSFTSPNIIVWLNNPIAPPELEGKVIESGGSGLGTAAFSYKIAALDENGEKTLLSNEVILQGTTGNASHKLSWFKPKFVTGYEIYDSTANSLIAKITSADTVEYLRTSNDSTSVTLPSVNKSRRVPGYGSDYYVSYNSIQFLTEVKNYSDLLAVQNDHGVGSDVCNMARIGFDSIKAPEMYIYGVDGTSIADFQAGINKLSAIADITNIFVLKDSSSLETYIENIATNDSKDSVGKYKFAFVSPSNTLTEIGNTSTAGTIRYWLKSWVVNGVGKVNLITPIPNGNKLYADSWQESDGKFTENKLVPNHFVAGTIAFLAANTEDVATSLIGKQIPGWNFGSLVAPWNDETEKDKFTNEGALYILNVNGKPTIYDDNTTEISILENFQRTIPNAEYEVRRRMKANLARYLGRKINKGLLTAIILTIKNTLEDAAKDQIIEKFDANSITAVQNNSVPTLVDVSWDYNPMYSLRNIKGTYGFNTKN